MSENHPSAEDIYIRIQTQLPTVSLDTVYRTLALFEEHGLINRVQSVSDKVRFDANTAPHHHFICMKCKRIIDFSWAEFDRLTLPEGVRSFGEIQDKKIELRGICCRCRKKLA
jgi:Fur family peroxide stress response transcriptional regulator